MGSQASVKRHRAHSCNSPLSSEGPKALDAAALPAALPTSLPTLVPPPTVSAVGGSSPCCGGCGEAPPAPLPASSPPLTPS